MKLGHMVLVGAIASVALAGCGSSDATATKEEQTAYTKHEPGSPPPADAMKPTGKAFIGEPDGAPSQKRNGAPVTVPQGATH